MHCLYSDAKLEEIVSREHYLAGGCAGIHNFIYVGASSAIAFALSLSES